MFQMHIQHDVRTLATDHVKYTQQQHAIEYVDIENCKSPSDFGWNFIQMISIKFQWVCWSPGKMAIPKTKMMASMLNGFRFRFRFRMFLCDITRDPNTRN